MFAKISTTLMVIVILAMGISFITSLPNSTAQKDSDVTLRVQGVDVTANGAPGQLGTEAVARVQAIAASNAPLTPGGRIGDYPADTAGLVAYAWKLPQLPELAVTQDWSHELRTHYAVEIPHQMLQPGDVLANDRSANYGHAIVFVQWSNPSQWTTAQSLSDRVNARASFEQGVPFVGYEIDRFHFPARVIQQNLTLKWFDGAMTIAELDRELHGPYYALRNNQIAGYAELLAPVSMKYTTSGSTVTARFSIINRGGAAVTLNNLSVIAYGPDAFHQGLAGAPTSFPEIKTVILQPGQIYQYQQTFAFSQIGTYLAVPHFVSNGTAQMPAQPTYFQITAH